MKVLLPDTCPYDDCDSEYMKMVNYETTTLGCFFDRNHKKGLCICIECNRKFIMKWEYEEIRLVDELEEIRRKATYDD